MLTSNKIFVAYSYTSDQPYLYGAVCTINGTTITKGTSAKLGTGVYSYAVSVVALSEDKVFIAHSNTNGSYTKGIVCIIEGNTITKRYRYYIKCIK